MMIEGIVLYGGKLYKILYKKCKNLAENFQQAGSSFEAE